MLFRESNECQTKRLWIATTGVLAALFVATLFSDLAESHYYNLRQGLRQPPCWEVTPASDHSPGTGFDQVGPAFDFVISQPETPPHEDPSGLGS